MIVLQTTEEKSSVNNFDVPRLRLIMTLIVDRLIAFVNRQFYEQLEVKAF